MRYKVWYIEDDDKWMMEDTEEHIWYDIDVSDIEKEIGRIERNHRNLHEKYEALEQECLGYRREYYKIKNTVDSAKRIYLKLKECFDEEKI